MDARSLVGKDILVGKTYYEDEDRVVRQEQYYGDIVEVDHSRVVIQHRGTGERTWVPAELDAIRPAPGGTYELSSTREAVVNPTLLTSWRFWIRHGESGQYYEIEPNHAPLRESRVPKEWIFKYSPNVDAFASVVACFSESYVGRTVLLGICHLNARGTVVRKEQVVGTIMRVGVGEGVVIRTDLNGHEITLPADLGLIERAPPGSYTLHDSGAVVEDPDYVAAFTFTEP